MGLLDASLNNPGTYEVVVDRKATTIEADSIAMDDEGLKVRKDGEVVAVFRWWDSVKRVGD